MSIVLDRADSGNESMGYAGTRVLPQSSVGAAAGEYDDGFDFPRTAHQGRELFTASLFVLVIITFVVWGGWNLISLT